LSFIYCEITFIRGVPIFVGRLIHEIKNPTNNETWEETRHRYIGKCCPRVTSTFWSMFLNYLILNACVKTTEIFICEKILTTSGYRNQIYLQTIHWRDTLLSVT
jgi:hypothetical protein